MSYDAAMTSHLRATACALLAVAACGGSIDATHAIDAGVDDGGETFDAGAVPVVDASRPDAHVAPPDAGFVDAPLPPVDAPHDAPDAAARHARVQIVNATNAFAARLCFATGAASDGSDAAVAPIPALPHDGAHPMPGTTWPGVARGATDTLPDLVDLSRHAVTPFVVAADKVKGEVKGNPNEATCDALLGAAGTGGRLVLGVDYFRLPTIVPGTLTNGGSFALGFFDCDANASGPRRCAGAFGAKVFVLEAHAPQPSHSYVSVLNLSAALATAAPHGIDFVHAYCGSEAPIVYGETFAADTPLPLDIDHLDGTSACDGVRFVARRADTSVAFSSQLHSLARVASLSTRVTFALGKSYTFVVLGDPATAEATLPDGSSNPAFDGSGVHVVALANDPVLPTL